MQSSTDALHVFGQVPHLVHGHAVHLDGARVLLLLEEDVAQVDAQSARLDGGQLQRLLLQDGRVGGERLLVQPGQLVLVRQREHGCEGEVPVLLLRQVELLTMPRQLISCDLIAL